jgi:hypothetical protein
LVSALPGLIAEPPRPTGRVAGLAAVALNRLL